MLRIHSVLSWSSANNCMLYAVHLSNDEHLRCIQHRTVMLFLKRVRQPHLCSCMSLIGANESLVLTYSPKFTLRIKLGTGKDVC